MNAISRQRFLNHMISIKIQCGCGQKYLFDVEPAGGRMPYSVACPVCGVDGTAAANAYIAQQIPVQFNLPVTAPVIAAAPVAAPPPVPARPAFTPARPAKANTSLQWYEQIWVALPLVLIAFGGAIGGGCGGAAWAVNRAVFKKLENPVLKYLVTALISGASVVLWLVLVGVVLTLLKRV
jgi:hypothetical protein